MWRYRHIPLYFDIIPFVGFVRSNAFLNFLQILSRLVIVWLILNPVPLTNIGPLLLLLAWSSTEIIRYLYYAWSRTEDPPYLLVWLRYSLFIVLYPMGVLGELISIYYALPIIKEQRTASLYLPNMLNFSFDSYYCILIILIGYLPGFPKLYMHMINQRAKYLTPGEKKKEKVQ